MFTRQNLSREHPPQVLFSYAQFYVLQHKINQTIIIFHLSFYLKSTRENGGFYVLKHNFSHNENEETYIGIERLQFQWPIFLKREHLPMGCSLTVAPFDKDTHILECRTAFRALLQSLIETPLYMDGAREHPKRVLSLRWTNQTSKKWYLVHVLNIRIQGGIR